MQSTDTEQTDNDGEHASLEWAINHVSFMPSHYWMEHNCHIDALCNTYDTRLRITRSYGNCTICKKEIPKEILFQLKLLRGR